MVGLGVVWCSSVHSRVVHGVHTNVGLVVVWGVGRCIGMGVEWDGCRPYTVGYTVYTVHCIVPPRVSWRCTGSDGH